MLNCEISFYLVDEDVEVNNYTRKNVPKVEIHEKLLLKINQETDRRKTYHTVLKDSLLEI